MNAEQQISDLRRTYAKVRTVDPSGETYRRLCALLDRMDNDTLAGFAGAGIPWVSSLALNRCVRRGLVQA